MLDGIRPLVLLARKSDQCAWVVSDRLHHGAHVPGHNLLPRQNVALLISPIDVIVRDDQHV